MRTISGAILILAAEQAFAHAHMASFPNEPLMREVMFPASGFLLVTGLVLLGWGLKSDRP
jgi:hypothetical protein